MLPTLPIPSGPRARRHLLPRPTPPTVVTAIAAIAAFVGRGKARGRAHEEAGRGGGGPRRVFAEDLARAGGGARGRAYCAALVGPVGVGKTTIVEGLAQRITAGNVPDTLVGARIIMQTETIYVDSNWK
ncbi:hypothetical protein ZWY2020_038712 [Hordeum vulgare]|nr:hypothetical protein ZWY2020_038712 [Hordeum vulgare]